MIVTSRSYLTAGVAALSVGAIALAPIQPIPTQLALAPQRVSDLSVQLAGAIDPFTPIADTINASADNILGLLDDWTAGLYVDGTIPTPPNTTGIFGNGNLGNRTGGYESGKALPIFQQFLANQLSYFYELPNIGTIFKQIVANIGNAVRAPFAPGVELPGTFAGFLSGQYNQNVSGVTVTQVLGFDVNPRTVGALLPVLTGQELYDQLKPIIDFTTTPFSGALLGAIGPVLAPVLSSLNSVTASIAALKAADFAGAINELINLPTNAVNAFLNGGPVLNLTKILGGVLPAEIQSIGIKMGGLLSPGGVAFDAVAANATALGATVSVPGLPIGPIGATIAMTNFVAKAMTPPTTEAAVGATASRNAKAAAAVDAPAPVAVDPVVAKVADAASVTDEAPVPARKSRAASRADSGGSGHTARAERGARRAG